MCFLISKSVIMIPLKINSPLNQVLKVYFSLKPIIYYILINIVLLLDCDLFSIRINANTILPIACRFQHHLNGCPLPHLMQCNSAIGYCECKSGFTIVLSSYAPCLNGRKLGQECYHSEQCNYTTGHSACYDILEDELNDIAPLRQWLSAELENNPNKQEFHPIIGRCKCRIGYLFNEEKDECIKVSTVSEIGCDGSHKCMNWDLNSHCDRKTKLCSCDNGYHFDSNQDKCVVSARRFGDQCLSNMECRSWDANMDCRSQMCMCRNGHHFDMMTQRCKNEANLDPRCRYNKVLSDYSGDCYPINGNSYHHASIRGGRGLNGEKLLEVIIVTIFFIITVFVLRNWRSMVPESYRFVTDPLYDYNYNNYNTASLAEAGSNGSMRRGRRRRLSSLLDNSHSSTSRVIHMRVNLESPTLFVSSPHEIGLNLTPPLSPSTSSLPPYELANCDSQSISDSTFMLPISSVYSDLPPSYEEAIAMISNMQANKDEDGHQEQEHVEEHVQAQEQEQEQNQDQAECATNK